MAASFSRFFGKIVLRRNQRSVSKRVFLSYKRHSDPDEGLALEVHRALAEAGHHVFIDQEMSAGVKWAAWISDRIRDCDALIRSSAW